MVVLIAFHFIIHENVNRFSCKLLYLHIVVYYLVHKDLRINIFELFPNSLGH